jgi:hypothetical protein
VTRPADPERISVADPSCDPTERRLASYVADRLERLTAGSPEPIALHLGLDETGPPDDATVRIPRAGTDASLAPLLETLARRDPPSVLAAHSDRRADTLVIDLPLLDVLRFYLRDAPAMDEDRRRQVDPLWDRPIVDELLSALGEQLHERGVVTADTAPPVDWPGDHGFAAFLSHDIDLVNWGTRENASRHLRNAVRTTETVRYRLEAVGLGIESLLRGQLPAGRGPEDQRLDPWRTIETRNDVPAAYFIAAPEEPTVDDPVYRLDDPIPFQGEREKLHDVLGKLAEDGCEIGLHGSLSTATSAAELRSEKRTLEAATGVQVAGVRQHHLDTDHPRTLRLQSQAGFVCDSSIGFNRAVGFPMGTCLPVQGSHVTETDKTGIVELPITVQDSSLDWGDRAQDASKESVRALIGHVERVGGVLGASWHNAKRRGDDPENRIEAYEWLVEELRKRDAWIATPSEIADHVRGTVG